jgi:hypothetical protein
LPLELSLEARHGVDEARSNGPRKQLLNHGYCTSLPL